MIDEEEKRALGGDFRGFPIDRLYAEKLVLQMSTLQFRGSFSLHTTSNSAEKVQIQSGIGGRRQPLLFY